MLIVERLTADAARGLVSSLIALLRDAVAGGASVGFLPPLVDAAGDAYWSGVIGDLAAGVRLLFVARDDGRLVGTVQLALATQPNAGHRAEVQKLIVHTGARRRGIGTALMTAVETGARDAGRTLVVLDTRRGDPSEELYLRRGYTRVGIIPRYARSADGNLDDTVIFYRWL